ncbi:MAG: Gfo/Idh/MocA family oxidoreductase [Candidatus Aminicenantes bacterium]|nr:Gfo/Idh/MocA family oxidoreductase [Candidatus Aminicenantes bacterium]
MKHNDLRSEPVSIVLCGIGGMGAVYVQALLERIEGGEFRIEGAVDPVPERCPQLARLSEMKIPIYSDLESFYLRREAEFAIVSSPIQFHASQTCLALDRGSHVLCEKPMAATIQDARRMARAREGADRWLAIGYQWSFSAAIQNLKADIRSGLFGRPIRYKCLYLWPRDEAYYGRNDWAGKKRNQAGAWVLDSPANNAMAHDLHNMFYVLGGGISRSAVPVEIEAELYRAYDVENFDTAAVRGRTDSGVEFLFLVSHVSRADRGPIFCCEFERGTVFCEGRNTDIKARLSDGSLKTYGCPDQEPMKKLWDCFGSVRTGAPPVCGPDAAMSQTLCVNGMQDSMPEIVDVPRDLLIREGLPGQGRIRVEGLDEIFERGYASGQLPSEMGVPWARRGRKIDLRTYERFPAL